MRKPTIKDRIQGVLMLIPELCLAIIRGDKTRIELCGLLIKLTAKGRFEIKEEEK